MLGKLSSLMKNQFAEIFRIFSTPSTIFKLSGSVGMALMCWVIGAIISTCGVYVMMELGMAMPRSGGIKNYLERAFQPRLMQTCIYIFYCIFLRRSISFHFSGTHANLLSEIKRYRQVTPLLSRRTSSLLLVSIQQLGSSVESL